MPHYTKNSMVAIEKHFELSTNMEKDHQSSFSLNISQLTEYTFSEDPPYARIDLRVQKLLKLVPALKELRV